MSEISSSEIEPPPTDGIESTMNLDVQAGHFTGPEWLFGICKRWSHSGQGISRFCTAADFSSPLLPLLFY